MRKTFLFLIFILFSYSIFAVQTWTYDWEDGVGTCLATYGTNLVVSNTNEQAYNGTRSLKMYENPLSGTPQAFIWWVTGLTDGDQINASFYVYDDDVNTGSGRIWAHYTSDPLVITSYSGSAGGNSTYSSGTGWNQLSWSWTFANSGDDDGIVIEARIYSATGQDILYIDDAYIWIDSDTALIYNVIDEVLPVNLSAFYALYIGGTPTLYWTTQTETENAYWNVYRGTNNNFTEAMWLNANDPVPGNGTTNNASDYVYIDNAPVVQNSTYWYWIEDVSFDGETVVHEPITLEIPFEDTPITPDTYGLHQNYPNPFNPSTSISFALEEESDVELIIYNVKGAKIRTIFTDHVYANDITSVVWDGNDADGKKVSCGVYFYKLITETKEYQRKMLLVK